MIDYKDYIGKTILIDLQYYNTEDEFLGGEQVAGTIIESIDDRIRLLPVGSEIPFHLPPDFSMLEKADAGSYTIQNGNVETFEDPDFTAVYEIVMPGDEWESMYPDGFMWSEEAEEIEETEEA
jgi:hypothetical protein